MKRIHLFEFEDLGWLPHAWRDMMTDFLQFFMSKADPYRPVVPELRQVLEKLNCRRVIDLCSGGGGPWLDIVRQLEVEENYPVAVTLTDKYPNLEAFRRVGEASNGSISHVEYPVEATAVPKHLGGFRTLFAGFHHLKPAAAKKVLQAAIADGEGIGIFEVTEKSARVLAPTPLVVPLLFAFVWLATPFLRPFKWTRLLWTYLVPVIPIFCIWDATISNLRTYSFEEVEQLIEELGCEGYAWESGRFPSRVLPTVSYILGYPTSSSADVRPA